MTGSLEVELQLARDRQRQRDVFLLVAGAFLAGCVVGDQIALRHWFNLASSAMVIAVTGVLILWQSRR